MRPPRLPQGVFRRPLNTILATEGNVRVLREVLRHGGELGVSELAARSGLSPQHVRLVLAHLVKSAVVEALGLGRARLYRARVDHPLSKPLETLFRAEDERFAALRSAIRRAAQATRPQPVAVWLYGSVARGEDTPESDLDLAIVAEEGSLDAIVGQMRESLRDRAEALGASLAIVGVTPADVRRAQSGDPRWQDVVRDAIPIVGPDPGALLADRRAGPPRAVA
ncbi:MAG: nucleotidyltransferase domain-containing protein [Geminicoccaceae bacterium]